jgi:hypothetical protein
MDTKLQQATGLQARLTQSLDASKIQIEAAKAALGAALALKALSMPGVTTVESAQRHLDDLMAKQERDKLQLRGLKGVIQQIQPGSGNENMRGTPDRHAKIAQAQKDYNRLWTKLNIKANSTGRHIVTEDVFNAFQELLEAGRILKHTNKIGDLAEVWQLVVERDAYGG